ncbi:23S rRNA (adenine(2503)-C(2))-methyltransferase RlmN [Balneolales bacterium ANBcel1]|nr:23S rRNA (adenine(2503)-C(2))-methyltransferase RlmN [Balneolales bacterium ANBcel1]
MRTVVSMPIPDNTTPSSGRTNLSALSREQLSRFCRERGLKRYRSDQIFQWIHHKNAASFDEMTNLPKALRDELSEHAELKGAVRASINRSKDGTTKCLFRLHDEKLVEAVLIPEFFDDGVADRLTVCVSSQVGCVFGCSFCATGKMGLFRNLTIGEITGQVLSINAIAEEEYGKRITNVVYMGMGEPFHNYAPVVESAAILCDPLGLNLSPKRITLSTVGLTRQIRQYADENHAFNLAISLHAADDDKRNRIMPINESLNLKALRESLEHYHRISGNGVTYEYLLFDRFNDTPDDARKLARISRWVPSKVNIIMYNDVEGVTLQRAKEERLNSFLAELNRLRVRATVRRSRGDDIDAGCGQLAIKEQDGTGKTMAKNNA